MAGHVIWPAIYHLKDLPVFRPLVGKLISQPSSPLSSLLTFSTLFPSPCGEIDFSTTGTISVPYTYTGFRPLAGKLISQRRKLTVSPQRRRMWFPSPCGEIDFSTNRLFEIGQGHDGFRPLAGKLISQRLKPFMTWISISRFPSPCGEIDFSTICSCYLWRQGF